MPPSIVSNEWLSTHLDDVVVVDVRREWEYDETPHIPGAVNIPYQEFRDPTDDTAGKLPTADSLGRLLGGAGIDGSDDIVAYDDEFGVYASRFLVTAEVFGHDFGRLHLLDGDLTGWDRDYDTSMAVRSPTPTEYTCALEGDSPIVEASELEAALDTDAVIVDTRDVIEYETVHLPGAVNLQWRTLVDEDARTLRPPDELLDVFAADGMPMERPVPLYCNTARRLSFCYLILRHLGHEDVAFYEGGIDTWAEYGGPVETTT